MTILEAAVLGAVQGLTEFLPVSSSGHLVIFHNVLGLTKPDLTFDISLHLATLVAVVLFFWKDLWSLRLRDLVMLGIGTIPAGLVGVFFKDSIEAQFASVIWAGVTLAMTGVINIVTDRALERQQAPRGAQTAALEQEAALGGITQIRPLQAILIGVAQAIAIIPGISRSGSTVGGAILLGVNRETAFRFSFLLSVPAILGAALLQFKDAFEQGVTIDPLTYGVGSFVSFLLGLASLAVFRYVIVKARLEWFGWYCIVVGLVTVAVELWR